MEKYIKVKENLAKVTHLKIELYYSLGGFNAFTHRTEKRGYYLSVIPIETHTSNSGYTTVTITAFSGIKHCIKEVSRKSKKAEHEAEKLSTGIINELIYYVCDKNGLEIIGEK